MNSIAISGKVMLPPLVKDVAGKKVVNFIISVAEAGSFNVEAWGRLADYLENNAKVDTYLAISGKLKLDKWKEKTETGEAFRERVKIVASSIEACGPLEPLEFESEDFDPFA